MKRVRQYPNLPPGQSWGETVALQLLDILREFAQAINDAADGRLWPASAYVTASYTAAETDLYIPVKPAAPLTVTLPAAERMKGKRVVVKRLDASTHTITINTAGGNIDAGASVTLTTAWQSREFISDGIQYGEVT